MTADPLNCKLVLSLHRFGKGPVHVAFGLGPEYGAVPDRDALVPVALAVVSPDTAADILKRRELTLDMIRQASRQLGGQLADYLADEGGWHGEDRREAARKHPRRGDWPL